MLIVLGAGGNKERRQMLSAQVEDLWNSLDEVIITVKTINRFKSYMLGCQC